MATPFQYKTKGWKLVHAKETPLVRRWDYSGSMLLDLKVLHTFVFQANGGGGMHRARAKEAADDAVRAELARRHAAGLSTYVTVGHKAA